MEAKMIIETVVKAALSGGWYVAQKYPVPCAISTISLVLYLFLPSVFFFIAYSSPFVAALAYFYILPRRHPHLSDSDLNSSPSSSDDPDPDPSQWTPDDPDPSQWTPDDPDPSHWTPDDSRNLMHLGHSDIERNRRLETLIARRRSSKLLHTTTLHRPTTHTSTPTPEDHPPGSAPSVLHPRQDPFDLPYDPFEEKPDLAADTFQQEFTLPRTLSATDLVAGDAPHSSGAAAPKIDDDTSSFRFPESLPCPVPRAASASPEEKVRKDGATLNALVSSHRSCNSIASDMQVEVSETGSPPFTVDGSGSSCDGDSSKYDGDVDKDASSGSDDIWGASPHAPPRNIISCVTEGKSSSEVAMPAEEINISYGDNFMVNTQHAPNSEEQCALAVNEEVIPFGNSEVDVTDSQGNEVIPRDRSRSSSPKSVMQLSTVQINERALSDGSEHITPFVSEPDEEERAVSTDLMEAPLPAGTPPSLSNPGTDHIAVSNETYRTEKKDDAEASKDDNNGRDICESGHGEDREHET